MTVTKENPGFHSSQPVSVNDPTHFHHIKSGVLLARDPDHPGFWEVSTVDGVRWFHERELAPASVAVIEATPEPVVAEPEPPAEKPKRGGRQKGPPRTILVDTTATPNRLDPSVY